MVDAVLAHISDPCVESCHLSGDKEVNLMAFFCVLDEGAATAKLDIVREPIAKIFIISP